MDVTHFLPLAEEKIDNLGEAFSKGACISSVTFVILICWRTPSIAAITSKAYSIYTVSRCVSISNKIISQWNCWNGHSIDRINELYIKYLVYNDLIYTLILSILYFVLRKQFRINWEACVSFKLNCVSYYYHVELHSVMTKNANSNQTVFTVCRAINIMHTTFIFTTRYLFSCVWTVRGVDKLGSLWTRFPLLYPILVETAV